MEGADRHLPFVACQEFRCPGSVRLVPAPFRTILAFACALYLGGAHWAVLQVTAWTGMLVTRAPELGVARAVETTFDGAHPCRMCEAVEVGKQEEQKQQPVSPTPGAVKEVKLVSFKIITVPAILDAGVWQWPDFLNGSGRRLDAPPTPPPLA